MFHLLHYRPEIIAFYSGAGVMIFELLGSRIVGPYIGNSLFVWTSLIAIILGALSLGYFYGGKISDKKADLESISFILLLSSFSIFLLLVSKDFFLSAISHNITDIRFSSSIIALVLFSPTSFLLGMLSPIVTKMRLIDMKTSGGVVGKMGSIGTIGSIIGTLAAGFILIPLFGVTTLMVLLSLSMMLLSLLCEHKKYVFLQIIMCLCLILLLGNNYTQAHADAQNNIYIYDTPYSHIQVSERLEKNTGRNIRDLKIDKVTHAGMYTDSTALVYDYTKYYHLFNILVPEAKNILMLGGAAYSFPKSFIQTYTDKHLDVVEIDSRITDIARKHFRLKDHSDLSIYHQDARVFLNTTGEKYDAILGDAFGSFFSIPYQLTTLEVAQKKYDLLSENGIVILNTVASLGGDNSSFLMAEYKTYSQVFPEVFVIPVTSENTNMRQNIMLVALKNPENNIFTSLNNEYAEYLEKKRYLNISEDTDILTDDYAPVDYYITKMAY